MNNARVRVLNARIPAGDKTPMHSHPDHVVYILNGGVVKLTYPSGKEDTMDLGSGKAIYMEAQSHEVTKLSDKDIDIVVIELRGDTGPYAYHWPHRVSEKGPGQWYVNDDWSVPSLYKPSVQNDCIEEVKTSW